MQPGATGDNNQVVLYESQDRRWVGSYSRGWMWTYEAGLGGGTEEEQAREWRRRACFVPVSTADEVTKMILNSPKALTARCNRCYCPRQSNTTVWICRENKNDKRKCRKKQRLGAGRHTDTRSGRITGKSFRSGKQERMMRVGS